MADEFRPESTHAGFSDLGRFMRRIDRKIGHLLGDFTAERGEITWVFEVLRCKQESLKTSVLDAISRVFENNSEDEVGEDIIGALARSFWKREELIDARLDKCCQLFGEVTSSSDQSSESSDEYDHFFCELDSFMRDTDEKMGLLLEDFTAEGNEMTWLIEALRCTQESLKTTFQDVIGTVVDSNRKCEEHDDIEAALARPFWKEEELIDARLDKCRELLRGVPILKPTDCDQSSDVPDKCEEARESGVAGSPVKEARDEEPKEDSKPPCDSNQSSDVLDKREERQDLDVIDAHGSYEESRAAATQVQDVQNENPKEENNLTTDSDPSSDVTAKSEEGQGLDKIDSEGSESGEESGVARSRVEVEEARNEKLNEEHQSTSDSDHSSDVSANSEETSDVPARVLQPLTPSTISGSPPDKENPRAVIPASVTVVSFSELIRFVGRVDRKIESVLMVFKEGGRDSSEVEDAKISQVQVKDRLDALKGLKGVGDGENLEVVVKSPQEEMVMKSLRQALMEQEQAIDARVDKWLAASVQVTDEGLIDARLSNCSQKMQNENPEEERKLTSKSSSSSEDSGNGANCVVERRSIQVKLTLVLVELFLLLSTIKKGFKFKVLMSWLEGVDWGKTEATAAKTILQVLTMVDHRKGNESTRRQEELDPSSGADEDNQLPEVQELLDNSMILISQLDSLLDRMEQFESRLLAEKGIRGLETNTKDMRRKLQDMESTMELLRSRFNSYAEYAPILTGISDALALEMKKYKVVVAFSALGTH